MSRGQRNRSSGFAIGIGFRRPWSLASSPQKQKNGRGKSSAALLSGQRWMTTFGFAGAFNPERPGIRTAKQFRKTLFGRRNSAKQFGQTRSGKQNSGQTYSARQNSDKLSSRHRFRFWILPG
jgi:hypothetical protein